MITSNTAQCRIIYYNWDQRVLYGVGSPIRDLSKATPFDISYAVMEANFKKNMSNPAGSFSFTLASSVNAKATQVTQNGFLEKNYQNWQEFIRPGTWCTIEFSNNGDLNIQQPESDGSLKPVSKPNVNPYYLRCIGYIERVALKGTIQNNGVFEEVFTISGSDFGIIYQNTNIWYNFFTIEKSLIEATNEVKLRAQKGYSINALLQTIHDLYFCPGKIPELKGVYDINSTEGITALAKQWILPKSMIEACGLTLRTKEDGDSISYYGNIKGITNFESTIANFASSSPLSFINGIFWDRLKEISIQQLHELFFEYNEWGYPSLNFRPIPFGINATNYPDLRSKIALYKDIRSIEISSDELYSYDVGEDDHNRKNVYLTYIQSQLISRESNAAFLYTKKEGAKNGYEFPRQNRDSIARHGMREMFINVPSFTNISLQENNAQDVNLILQYNELLYDYWNSSVLAQSGAITLNGRNDVRIGKCLEFSKNSPRYTGTRFYIEGYSDTFQVLSNGATVWNQVVYLTHGLKNEYLQRNGENINLNYLDTRPDPFVDHTTYHASFSNTQAPEPKKPTSFAGFSNSTNNKS